MLLWRLLCAMMTDFVIVELHFFGALSKIFISPLFFNLETGKTLSILRKALLLFVKKNIVNFSDEYLLMDAVFSNYNSILPDSFIVDVDQKFFVLPPASGG